MKTAEVLLSTVETDSIIQITIDRLSRMVHIKTPVELNTFGVGLEHQKSLKKYRVQILSGTVNKEKECCCWLSDAAT